MLLSSTCVGLRYGHLVYSLEGFSWQSGLNHFSALSRVLGSRRLEGRDFPLPSAYFLEPPLPPGGWSTPLRPPLRCLTQTGWYRIIRLFTITYAAWPRLRARLTRGGRPYPSEPLDFRRTGFSPVLSLLMPASSLLCPPSFLSKELPRAENVPLPSPSRNCRRFGGGFEPRWIVGANTLDQ